MTWVRTEDDQPLHPKFLRLSDGAYRLWGHGLAFANRGVTDGKIEKVLVPSLNHHGRWTSKQLAGFVAELVPGLWVDEGDHYRIHDYEDHQAEAMKERVEKRREYERNKKRDQRAEKDRTRARVPSNVPAGQREGHGKGRHQGHPDGHRPVSSVPTRPVPEESASHSPTGVREATRPAVRSTDAPRWLRSAEGPDAVTDACLRAFDAGYASATRGGEPLRVANRYADEGVAEHVAAAREIDPENPARVFERAGAEVARRVARSAETMRPIAHPWAVFLRAPIGTFLAAGSAEASPTDSGVERAERRLREARAAYDAGFGQEGARERLQAVEAAKADLRRARAEAPGSAAS